MDSLHVCPWPSCTPHLVNSFDARCNVWCSTNVSTLFEGENCITKGLHRKIYQNILRLCDQYLVTIVPNVPCSSIEKDYPNNLWARYTSVHDHFAHHMSSILCLRCRKVLASALSISMNHKKHQTKGNYLTGITVDLAFTFVVALRYYGVDEQYLQNVGYTWRGIFWSPSWQK